MKKLVISLFFVSVLVVSTVSYMVHRPKNDIELATTNTPAATTPTKAPTSQNWIDEETKRILAKASNINPKALKVSLEAYAKARREGLDSKGLLTLVDYSIPSSSKRLWVIDVNNTKILFNTWVAHGKNSGAKMATSFSNSASSLKSSLGVFITDEPYTGHDGYSLRVRGLEKGFNDHAYNRAVVFHGANYVSAEVAKDRDMVGRSWGCFAVPKATIASLINTVKEGTLVVAYYPDKKWLSESSFVTQV